MSVMIISASISTALGKKKEKAKSRNRELRQGHKGLLIDSLAAEYLWNHRANKSH